MGKTRNNYLVEEHMDDEEFTVFDWEHAEYLDEDNDWYVDTSCSFEYDEDRVNTQVPFVRKEEQEKQVKEWDGKVVKGVPSLYQLALDALPSKTRMALAKFTFPQVIVD